MRATRRSPATSSSISTEPGEPAFSEELGDCFHGEIDGVLSGSSEDRRALDLAAPEIPRHRRLTALDRLPLRDLVQLHTFSLRAGPTSFPRQPIGRSWGTTLEAYLDGLSTTFGQS